MNTIQTECRRCGTCCTKGGPALHRQDLPLIKSGKIPRTRLITIRKGELVYKPFGDIPQAATCELIKICGTGRDWQCFYFNDVEKCCNIYAYRPVTCSTLQCWDTAAIEKLVERETISRFDILGTDDPMYAIIKEHERDCPCPDLSLLLDSINRGTYLPLESFEKLVNADIKIRDRVVKRYDLTLADELFFFGRPIFQLLQQLGVQVKESDGRLKLHWP